MSTAAAQTPPWQTTALLNRNRPPACVKVMNCITIGRKHDRASSSSSSISCCLHTLRGRKKSDGKLIEVAVSLEDGFSSYDDEEEDEDRLGCVVLEKLNALYRFSRPHTVIGTVIGITSVSLLPVESFREISPAFFLGLIKAVVPSVCMNIYVVGLNQLFDVQIDKVNKPTLPLASGEFSMVTGVTIVAASLILSLYMGIKFQSPPLLAALLVSFLLGTVYSVELPLMRWKRHPFLAASCILIVRAFAVQIAFFLHMQKYVLGKPVVITKTLVFATSFMCFFSVVIALFKDIPDLNGDRDFGIQSFTVKLGQEKVFWICVKMLLVAYVAGVVMGASSPYLSTKIITIAGHSTLAWMLWSEAQTVDVNSNSSLTSFYMFIWKLFYAEYFLLPFVN